MDGKSKVNPKKINYNLDSFILIIIIDFKLIIN